jgi:hypothetical protein
MACWAPAGCLHSELPCHLPWLETFFTPVLRVVWSSVISSYVVREASDVPAIRAARILKAGGVGGGVGGSGSPSAAASAAASRTSCVSQSHAGVALSVSARQKARGHCPTHSLQYYSSFATHCGPASPASGGPRPRKVRAVPATVQALFGHSCKQWSSCDRAEVESMLG